MSSKLRCVKIDARGSTTTPTGTKNTTVKAATVAKTKKTKSTHTLKRKISTISIGTQTPPMSMSATTSSDEVSSIQTSMTLKIARTMAMAAKMATRTTSSMMTIPTTSVILTKEATSLEMMPSINLDIPTHAPDETPTTVQAPIPNEPPDHILPTTSSSLTSNPTSAKSRPSTGKTKTAKSKLKTKSSSLTSTRSPFNSFVTTGSRRRQRSQSFDFSYDLSKDEVHFAGSFKGPMKTVPANERELLTSGQRGAYLAMRYGHSPDRKYNYPEATSWRIGWFHNQQSKQQQNLQRAIQNQQLVY